MKIDDKKRTELLEKIHVFKKHLAELNIYTAEIMREITRENHQDDDHGENNDRIQRLLTDSSDVVSIIDRRGIILYESPSAQHIFGSDEKRQRIGTNIFGFCHPEDLKQVIYTFSELVQHPRESRKIVFRFRRTDGKWILLESICRNFLNDPAIQGIIVSSRDITDRKRAEERIKIFEHVFKSANDSIVITDLQHTIIFVNQSFCNGYGYSGEEIIGKHIEILWPDEHTSTTVDELLTQSEGSGWEGDVYNKKKSGQTFPVHLSASVIKNDTGKPIAMSLIIRDISKQKQLEEQLRQSHKMESLSVLVGGIAHNFNNILGVIMGYTSLLDDPTMDRDKLNRNVRVISEAAERGAHLVHQLMTYIKKSPVRFADVEVHTIITEMAGMMKETFPQTITFSIDLEPGNPIVYADHGQIRQVLFNLLLNARDAMPNGGTITISTHIVEGATLEEKFEQAQNSNYLHIAVNDTGVGMDEELQNRIFDPFFTTKEIGKGVGLGLPMVYGIVESHNGFIDVTSTIDRGSTFSVYLPLSRVEESKSPERLQESYEKPNTGEALLVVEDEESMRILLADTFRNSGYVVYEAVDGKDAIELFEKEHNILSAVLLDIGLPVIGGYETFLRMKKINPKVPVVIASGYNDPDAKLAIETAGARLFIQKPYKFNHILKVVRDVIDQAKEK